MRTTTGLAATSAIVLAAAASHAADWSDTAISWRHGDSFREPFGGLFPAGSSIFEALSFHQLMLSR